MYIYCRMAASKEVDRRFRSWFLVFGLLSYYTATQLAIQLPQRRIQVVRSNRVSRKRPAESNGTPAMDTGHINIDFDVYIIV